MILSSLSPSHWDDFRAILTDWLSPYMIFHGLHQSIACDINAHIPCPHCTCQDQNHWLWWVLTYLYIGCIRVWVGQSKDSIVVQLPVIEGTAAFPWIQCTTRWLNKVVPPLQLTLHLCNKLWEGGMLIACQHSNIVDKGFDALNNIHCQHWVT